LVVNNALSVILAMFSYCNTNSFSYD